MSTRRPLSRVRYDPIIGMWVVSPTEHTPPSFQGVTAFPSWREAMIFAHRVAGWAEGARRWLVKPLPWPPKLPAIPTRYAEGGVIPTPKEEA